MKYYEVNFNGNQLMHFLFLHQNDFIGTTVILGMILLIAVVFSAAAKNRGATIIFFGLFGASIISLSLNAAVIALMLFTLILGLPATLMFDLNKVLIAGLCIAGAALVNIILTLYIGFSKDRKRE